MNAVSSYAVYSGLLVHRNLICHFVCNFIINITTVQFHLPIVLRDLKIQCSKQTVKKFMKRTPGLH